MSEKENGDNGDNGDKDKMFKMYSHTESFMAFSGIMMERDVYGIYPGNLAVNSQGKLVGPDDCVGFVHGDPRPKGNMFKGKNRKERRKLEKGII